MRSHRQPPQKRRKRNASGKAYPLFDISTDIEQIIFEITEAQHDKNHDLVEELTCQLLDLISTHEDKYEACVHVIKNSLNAAEGNQAIANEFQAIATAHNNVAKRVKEMIKNDMERHGLKKVDAGIFNVRMHKNSVPTLHVYCDAEELPKRFQKIEINNDELRFALAHGEEVENAELVKGEHVRISAKREKN